MLSVDKKLSLFLQEISGICFNLPLLIVNLYATVYGSPRAKNPFLQYAHAPERHHPQLSFHQLTFFSWMSLPMLLVFTFYTLL